MSDEPEVDPVLEEANHLFDQEKYEAAIKLYDKLIAERKLGAEPPFMKAECLSNLHRYGEAITWYDKAIDIDDENALIWNGKGNAFYHLENYVQARVCFECAYDLDPQTPDYLFSVIETAILTGDIEDAVNMSREALNSTEDTSKVILSWGFSIIALFLQQKPLNAVETIDELVQYMREEEARHEIERSDQSDSKSLAYTGTDYDLCGVEKVIDKRVRGASSKLLQELLSYLKGDVSIDELGQVRAENSDAITLEDVLVEETPSSEGPAIEEYPDVDAIVDPVEQDAIKQINGLIEEFAGEFGFQSFDYIFDEYNWNQDRGPAPFLEEILNRFFIEIVNGQVTRLSIDLDILAAALIPDGQKDAQPTAATYAQAGQLLRFKNLEELYVTAKNIPDIVETMRAASFGKDKELTLFVNVELIPDLQEDLVSLDKIDEITEIDEIPVDYQDEGKRVVGSMVWTATR